MPVRTTLPRIGAAFLSAAVFVVALGAPGSARSQTPPPAAPPPAPTVPAVLTGAPLLKADALFANSDTVPDDPAVSREAVGAASEPFAKSVRITVTSDGPANRFTPQLAMLTVAPVAAGDTVLLTLSIRGAASTMAGATAGALVIFGDANTPPRPLGEAPAAGPRPRAPGFVQFVSAESDPSAWHTVQIPFRIARAFDAGAACLSIYVRASQSVDLAGLSLVDLGSHVSMDAILTAIAEEEPSRNVAIAVDRTDYRQTMAGFGGNFAVSRLPHTGAPDDAVGQYQLDHMNVAHARLALPLDTWAPIRGGAYSDTQGSHASLVLMREMARQRIPMVLSIWEAPDWMVVDPSRRSQRVIAPERYGDCVEAIAQFLIIARDKYGATADYLSFSEADAGWDVQFTPEQIDAFIKQAAPRFAALGVTTKWLVGDTSSGQSLIVYARPLLEDKDLAPYLGPISFHSWDVLRASDADYAALGALGREFDKPVWCLEMGYDAWLYRVRPEPWATFDNALKLSWDYARTLRLTEASLVDYWQYQNDFPLSGGPNGDQPYPAMRVLQQIFAALPRGARVVRSLCDDNAVAAIAAEGPDPGVLHIVLVNAHGPAVAMLTGVPAGVTLTAVRSTTAGQNVPDDHPLSASSDGRLTLDLPARSVTTLVSR